MLSATAGRGADRPTCRPADDRRRRRRHRRRCQCCRSSSSSFLLLHLLLLRRQKSGIPCWPVSTCPSRRESSRLPSWRQRRLASSRSRRSSSCASASPSRPAGRAAATTTIRRSRPRRLSTGTIGAGRTRWETPSRGLGGGGGRRRDDDKGGRESCSRRVNGCVASASAPVVHVLPGQGRRRRASRGGEVFPGDSGGVGATPMSRVTTHGCRTNDPSGDETTLSCYVTF